MKTKTLLKTVFLIISISIFSAGFISCEKNNEFTDDSNIIGKWENIKIEEKSIEWYGNYEWDDYPGVIGTWEFTEKGEFLHYSEGDIIDGFYTYNDKSKVISFDKYYPFGEYFVNTVEKLTKNELVIVQDRNHKTNPKYIPNQIWQFRYTFKRIK